MVQRTIIFLPRTHHFTMRSTVYQTIWMFICFCLGNPILSAHHDLQGMVKSQDNGEPLIGATIQINESPLATTSDLRGLFVFNDLEEGEYRLSIEYLGFEKRTLSVQIPLINTAPLLEIELVPTKIDLPSVEVRTRNRSEVLLNELDQQLRVLRTGQDYLQVVPGLFLAQHAGGGKAEQLFLRGFDLDHGTDLSIKVDGVPVNMVSHAHGQGYADLHFLIPETIDEVLYQKGPYQAHSGNLSTAGTVEFKTKDHIHQSIGKIEMGQFGRLRATALVNLIDRPRDSWYVGASREYMEGYFISPQHLNRLHLTQQYSHWFDQGQKITFSTNHFASDWLASGQIPVRAVESGQIDRFGAIDDTEGGQTTRTDFRLALHAPFSSGGILQQTVYATYYTFDLYSNFTFFANDPVNGDQIRQRENRWMYGLDGSYSIPHRLFNHSGFTRIGWQSRYDISHNNELSRTLNRSQTLEQLALGDIQEWNGALYLQESFSPIGSWQIDLSLRYDQFYFSYVDFLAESQVRQTNTAGILSPKLHLKYEPYSNLAFYGRLGRGFHSNDTRLMVQPEDQATLAAAWGSDLGIRFKPFAKLIFDFSAWQLDLEEELVYVGDEAVIEPSGATKRRGVDLSARWELIPNLIADADATFTKARFLDLPEAENLIPLAPRHTATGGLTWQSPGGVQGSARFRYLSDRPATEDGALTATGYWLADASLAYQAKNWRLGIDVQNLLNTEWEEAQFATTSRLINEAEPVTEIHYTPGSPFFLNSSLSIQF